MDCFAALAMTMPQIHIRLRDHAARSARVMTGNFAPKTKEGTGNAGCALHPRSRVHDCAKETHTSIQVQRKHSGIPRAMALRLMARSSRRRIRLVTVIDGLRLVQARLGQRTSADLTPATGARTTRFCRTLHRRSSGALQSLTAKPPCDHGCTPDAAASTASHPNVRDDGQRPLVRG